ncbi:hypothetical protein HPB52_002523 [Rhipicephalus sanguineus]|uniref:CCHC-type domain-containing protein n=1 Tax=Rhipicephalus sanguineus TaxID=34632 RepID=A0A9D4T8B4_RHISA|nr:hypothetical protein HPB52_002523 [Rhipicephalus sanguineus]
MEYTVEGEDIDPAELNDGTWQHPKGSTDPLDALDLQKRFGRKKIDLSEPTAKVGLTGASVPAKRKVRPPRLPRRKPMPRLHEEDYKIVLRPKCAVDLTNIGLAALLESIHSTITIDIMQAEQADQVRVHPIKNTITISTPDQERVDAYRTIGQLRSEKYNIDMPVSAYVPGPDDSVRGVVYKAYTDETDQAIQSELAKKNPQLPIVNARRLGSSKHLVITFAGKDLPRLVRYRCFTSNVYPFRERPEACFNCRKLGHRADVCPLPRPLAPRCRRCGEEHSSPPEGEKPNCTPLCVVCHGKHLTGSRSCKYRFVQSKHTSKGTTSSANSQAETPTATVDRPSRSRQRTQETFRDRSESFPPLSGRSQSRRRSSSRHGSTEHEETSKWLAWESDTSGYQADTTTQGNPQRGASLEARPKRERSASRPRAGQSVSRATQGACRGSKSATQSLPKSPQDPQELISFT